MVVQRSGTGRGLGAAVARLSDHAEEWGGERLLDEGLDLVRDSTWADVVLLHSVERDRVRVVARRPGRAGFDGSHSGPDLPDLVPGDWFPWGLAPVRPKRFLLVDDASLLPVSPGGPSVGDLGLRSCAHLPINERGRPVGALHLYWAEPRLAWDDDHGRLLRTLGRFLLSTARDRAC